jgi:hypothetical protein
MTPLRVSSNNTTIDSKAMRDKARRAL